MGRKDPKSSSQTSVPTCVDTWEKHRREREQPERMHFSHRETEYYLKELIKLSNYFFYLDSQQMSPPEDQMSSQQKQEVVFGEGLG